MLSNQLSYHTLIFFFTHTRTRAPKHKFWLKLYNIFEHFSFLLEMSEINIMPRTREQVCNIFHCHPMDFIYPGASRRLTLPEEN